MSERVSANLRAIADMAQRLEERAIDRADDHDLPGGEAMVNLAPVADMSVWERRNELAGDALVAFEDPDEMWSSFQLLRFWSEQWRVELDMDHDDPRWRPSLASEAAFLRNPDVLSWAWDTEPHFASFVDDVQQARSRLEAVLMEGERADKLRVRCPDCTREAAQEAENAALSAEQVSGGESHQCDSERPAEPRTAPRLIAVYGPNKDADRWKCPTCKHKFTAAEVRRARASQMRLAGDAERWITVPDAVSILRKQGGWRESTIRAWANDAAEVSATVDDLGTRLVWWPDMWRLHSIQLWQSNENRRKAADLRARKAACRDAHGEDCWTRGRGCSQMLAPSRAV